MLTLPRQPRATWSIEWKADGMMKFSCFFLMISLSVFGQSTDGVIIPRVDQRVELLSIMHRLATGKIGGAANPGYNAAIDNHFKKYAGHSAIRYLKTIVDSLAKEGLDASAWELPSLAVHLSQLPELKPLVPYNATTTDGWDDRTLLKSNLVSGIQQFYRDSKSAAFFDSQRAYYQSIFDHYRKTGIQIKDDWLKDFFRLPKTESYFPIVALGASEGAYLRVNFADNKRHTATIFTVSAFDQKGLPSNFTEPSYSWLLLHEQVHSYANQLVDSNLQALQPAAEKLLKRPEVWSKFKDTFYNNWQFLLYESMVRACSLKYGLAHPDYTKDAEKDIRKQEAAGFVWMRGLVNELTRYEKDREKYPDLNTFMPEIVAYLNKAAN